MKKYEGKKVWFTSDLHFKHKNIIKYCNRPFVDPEHMEENLILLWNEHIKKDDIVYILGDFCFGGYTRWEEVLKRLNGEIHLILGNHDSEKIANKLLSNGFLKSVSTSELIEVDGQEIFLCHFPMLDWPNRERGSWMLHGHIHSLKNDIDISEQHYDVGVDHNEYYPINMKEIKSKISQYKEPKTTITEVIDVIKSYIKSLLKW